MPRVIKKIGERIIDDLGGLVIAAVSGNLLFGLMFLFSVSVIPIYTMGIINGTFSPSRMPDILIIISMFVAIFNCLKYIKNIFYEIINTDLIISDLREIIDDNKIKESNAERLEKIGFPASEVPYNLSCPITGDIMTLAISCKETPQQVLEALALLAFLEKRREDQLPLVHPATQKPIGFNSLQSRTDIMIQCAEFTASQEKSYRKSV